MEEIRVEYPAVEEHGDYSTNVALVVGPRLNMIPRDLAREIVELQPFLTKVAEGSFSYMTVDSASMPAENESVLTGVVVGKSGKTVPAEMRLRKDYGIWHLTYITNPS